MRCHALRKLLSIAAFGALSALTLHGRAQAQVIDFEAQPPVFYADGETFTDSGFLFTQQGFFGIIGASFDVAQAPINNESQFYSALNDSALAMSLVGGQAFDLLGFDAGFVPAAPQGPDVVAGRMVIFGTTVGGNSLLASWEFGASDAAGNFSFEHFATGLSSFTNLTSVTFVACVYLGDGCANPDENRAQFSLDNLNVVAVPEPSTYVLLALGLCGICVYTRRAHR